MFIRAIAALFIMICAVMIFISIQEPYELHFSQNDAQRASLQAQQISAQLELHGGINLALKSLSKTPAGDEISGILLSSELGRLQAERGFLQGQILQLSKKVNLLKNGIFLHTSSAKIDLKARKIWLDAPLVAYSKMGELSAQSGLADEENLELEEVKLCINY